MAVGAALSSAFRHDVLAGVIAVHHKRRFASGR